MKSRLLSFLLSLMVLAVLPIVSFSETKAPVWYLLLPPSQGEGCVPGGAFNCDYLRAWPLTLAPLERWRVDKAFDSAAACEKAQAETLHFWVRLSGEAAKTRPLKPEDYGLRMMRHYAASRCLPSEVISAPRRYYLVVPPYPLTAEAALSQWRLGSGFYFAADCERNAQNHRELAALSMKTVELVRAHHRKFVKEIDDQLSADPQRKDRDILSSQRELSASQLQEIIRLNERDAQGRYARCLPSEELPPGMLPMK